MDGPWSCFQVARVLGFLGRKQSFYMDVTFPYYTVRNLSFRYKCVDGWVLLAVMDIKDGTQRAMEAGDSPPTELKYSQKERQVRRERTGPVSGLAALEKTL